MSATAGDNSVELGDVTQTASAAASDSEDQTIQSLVEQERAARKRLPREPWEGASGPFMEDLLAGQINECKIAKGDAFDLNVGALDYDDAHMFSLNESVARSELDSKVQTFTSEDSLWLRLWIRAEGDGRWTAAWRAGARAFCLCYLSVLLRYFCTVCAGALTISQLVEDMYELVQKDHVVIGLQPERASATVKAENETRHEKEVRSALNRAVHGVIDVEQLHPDSTAQVEPWQPGDGPLEGKRVKFYFKAWPTLQPPLALAASEGFTFSLSGAV